MLFLDHRPAGACLFFFALVVLHLNIFTLGHLLPAHHVLPANLAIFLVLIVSSLVPRVVNPDEPPADLGSPDVVHCEVARPLVLVFEPAEALALARLLVARQFEEDWLAILGEDGDDVALGKLIGETAKIDKSRVAVVGVP